MSYPACTGDGLTKHIDNEVVPKTQPVTLQAGVIEVGRARPAEVVIPAPTVSSRHAIMRIGTTLDAFWVGR